MLIGNECDLAVMGRPPRELATRSEVFAAHPLVFVCPPRHPLLSVGQPPVHALQPYPFLMREDGSGTRHALETFFRENRFQPRITMEVASNETIKQAVIAGLGISFLSLHTIGLELRSGLLAIVEIEGTPLMRTWNVVSMQSKMLSPAAEAFRYFLLEQAEGWLVAHDGPLLKPSATPPAAAAPFSLPS